MKPGKLTPCAALLLLCLPLGAESIPVSEYRQWLHELRQKIGSLDEHPERAAAMTAEVPDSITVKTSGGEVSIANRQLRNDLASFSQAAGERRQELRRRLVSYTEALALAADDYERPGADIDGARSSLHEILARREFRHVREPDVKDTLLARFFRWLSRLLSRMAQARSDFDLARLFIYLLVAAAAAILVIWTVRQLRRPLDELPAREIVPFAPSARSWRSWLAEARDRAQQQDWRNAIHLAYWAGISRLEENGAWKPNRARTPREYLRLLGGRATQYPALAALTRTLEHVWYGYGEAVSSDFDEILGRLEELGCR